MSFLIGLILGFIHGFFFVLEKRNMNSSKKIGFTSVLRYLALVIVFVLMLWAKIVTPVSFLIGFLPGFWFAVLWLYRIKSEKHGN